jgi:hypothetical protein
MNAFSPVALGDADVRRVETTERLHAAITQNRELREELSLSISRLRVVVAQYEATVREFRCLP